MIPLLDTHQHLLYPNQANYSWTADIPALAGKSFTIEDYHDLTAGLGIGGTIFMESAVDDGGEQDEAQLIAKLAADPTNGILGIIASCRPETADGFDAWLDKGEQLPIVGYRRILHVVDDDMSASDVFSRNVRAIGVRGRVFDLCFLARQLPIALALARACDDMSLVLDHCGVPDIAGGELDPWRAYMRDLAALPHVSCKMSGVLAYCSPGQANYEAIRPFIDYVLDVFGPSRVVWGGDWPVVNLGNGLPDWISIMRKILSGLSLEEAEAVAHGNASRIYGVTMTKTSKKYR